VGIRQDDGFHEFPCDWAINLFKSPNHLRIINMEIIFIAIIIGLVPAVIARSKGRSFVPWWIYGSALFIIALPHALIMRALQNSDADLKHVALIKAAGMNEIDDSKICPMCAETIKRAAIKCRFCNHEFRSKISETTINTSLEINKKDPNRYTLPDEYKL
jgi:hypothetical protein